VASLSSHSLSVVNLKRKKFRKREWFFWRENAAEFKQKLQGTVDYWNGSGGTYTSRDEPAFDVLKKFFEWKFYDYCLHLLYEVKEINFSGGNYYVFMLCLALIKKVLERTTMLNWNTTNLINSTRTQQ
jgi:hypothetical protein